MNDATVTPSCKAVPQEPHMEIFTKWSGTLLLCGSYGVYLVIMESTCLLLRFQPVMNQFVSNQM